MDQIGAQALPVGAGYEWTAMSYQEKLVGAQIYFVFGLSLLLVYFVLAGQYESWILPLAVLLAVPLALIGTVGALTYLGAANNLYTQIGLILLIALASKNAILIVEYARQQRTAGREVVDAAVEAARLRFRPIIMTSFAFILGVAPLVVATGAGAGARRVDRNRRLQRHDRVDLPRGSICSGVLCGAATPRGAADTPSSTQGSAHACSAGGDPTLTHSRDAALVGK